MEAEILETVTTEAPEDDALPPDLEAVVAELESLDDQELWRAARSRFPVESSEQLETLHRKRRDLGLSEEKRAPRADVRTRSASSSSPARRNRSVREPATHTV